MKSLPLLFLGIFFALAFSFTGLVVSSQIQFGDLEPAMTADGSAPLPRATVGLAEQGKQVYIEAGCLYCHSQQLRRPGFGSDYERWARGPYRMTVARDYIRQKRVLLGTMRTGPDLANVGQRLPSRDWHYLHLWDPRIYDTHKNSIMPAFRYYFDVKPIKNGQREPDALNFPAGYEGGPPEGYQVVPTQEGKAIVEYLLSLRVDYELPEAPMKQ